MEPGIAMPCVARHAGGVASDSEKVLTNLRKGVLESGTAFLMTPPVAIAHFVALVLALVALLRAPKVLRVGRR